MPLTIQQLTGAAERLRIDGKDLGVDWLALVETARAHCNRRPFKAKPLRAYKKTGKGGKKRTITQAVPEERLIEEALRPLLESAVETNASDAAHGYRRGRSTYTAALAASKALASGRQQLLYADIEDFFGRLQWDQLDQCLTRVLASRIAELTGALARAPLRFGQEMRTRKRGIPLGRVISPYLANLYLAPLDTAMSRLPVHYIRFADDFLMLAASEDELNTAQQTLETQLAALGLKLNTEKSERRQYEGLPLPYLGHAIDADGVFDRMSGVRLERIASGKNTATPGATPPETPPPRRRSHTLYLTEPGIYLHIQSGLLNIRRGKELLREIPLHRLDRILVLSGASMSSGFFSACIAQQIPVLFFVGKGKAYGSLVASGMPNPWRLRAQYELLSDEHRRLHLARQIVLAKISAMRRRARWTQIIDQLRARLAEILSTTQTARDLDALRGCEGSATRTWYQIMNAQIHRPEFRFKKRSKRPPRDPINSLLSFSYSLIFGEMQTALLAEGLDPHPALLHESRPGHAALASDMVEPYRILIADSFVRGLINNRRVHAQDFHAQKNGGVYLQNDPRREVLEAFEEYMEQPGPGNRIPVPRQALSAAAHAMLRVVLGETRNLALPTPYEREAR